MTTQAILNRIAAHYDRPLIAPGLYKGAKGGDLLTAHQRYGLGLIAGLEQSGELANHLFPFRHASSAAFELRTFFESLRSGLFVDGDLLFELRMLFQHMRFQLLLNPGKLRLR